MKRGFGACHAMGALAFFFGSGAALAQEETGATASEAVDEGVPAAEGADAPSAEASASPEVDGPAEADDPAEPPSDGVSEQLMMESAPMEPAEPLPPPPKRSAGPYARGTINIGGTLGFISTIGGVSSRSWVILGLGAGYNVLDGLEARGDATFWIGDPFIATLTPGIRYVFHMVPVVQPYVGTFYRHYFVTGDLSDTDSVGARAGVNFQFTRGGYLGAGAVYEHFLDSNLFAEPDQVYPELTIAIAF